MMPPQATRPQQQPVHNRQEPSPPARSSSSSSEADGPLNLSKPKSQHGSRGSHHNTNSNYNGHSPRTPPTSGAHGRSTPNSSASDSSKHQQQVAAAAAAAAAANAVPPGLVLPPNFMPFATFPLPSGKLFYKLVEHWFQMEC